MTSSPDPVTQLLNAWSDGGPAGDRLLAAVYGELHRTARRYLHREHAGHTLQPTALVHEAYLRLIDQDTAWRNRAHFYAIAAQIMRRILVDHARARCAAKRGGNDCRITLDGLAAAPGAAVRDAEVDLLDLERCLTALAALDPRQAHIVELRFFAGLTIAETADVVGVSHTIIEREWSLARAWLRRELDRA
jgi:RNA polymerase sigma factor (TIGR02999 family)